VKTLADGASTLYGADAIAGLVNFITRKNSSNGMVDLRRRPLCRV
jgi:iron complex outermembrane receptor protein